MKHIKSAFKTDSKFVINFQKIRKNLYNVKHDVCKKSQLDECKHNTTIKVHDLDSAIKLACTNYSSSITNKNRNNIKNFRIRYWKYDKKIKFLDLEKNNFSKNTIRKTVFGTVKGIYNGKEFNFNKIKHDCKLEYNGFSNEYSLYIPVKAKKEEINHKSHVISLDPGIRTFMSGISENKIVKIGEHCTDKIKENLKKIDVINNNKEIPETKKLKLEKTINKKIDGYVNEIHWKTINYLTNNYKTIFIGNISSKKIISNSNNNQLSDITKRIISKLKFYKFREKLKYKCSLKKNNYKCVNESYTSRVCSNCGNEKNDLKDNKEYNCEKCKKKICRDINGARNIYIKACI